MERNDKAIQLVKLLLEKTREGAVEWEITGKEEVFQVSFSSSSIQISERISSQDEPFTPDIKDMILSIYNEVGTLVEEIDDVTLSRQGYTDAFSDMQEIYNLARRQALGADTVIDNILSDLNNLDIPF